MVLQRGERGNQMVLTKIILACPKPNVGNLSEDIDIGLGKA